jgi:hypothetical protein
MKYRQETRVERNWDGEFETYDEWAKFGRSPRTEVRPFSMRKIGVVLLRKTFLRWQRMGHSR